MTIDYPYMPEGKTIHYVGIDNPFMKEAEKLAKERSTDSKQPTGAVLVKDGRIIGKAANQSAIKNKKILALHQDKMCVRKMLGIKSGTKYWMCPGCATYRQHAEAYVVRNAQRRGEDTQGADVYLWGHWWCCEPCWNRMRKAGVKNVYLLKDSEKLFNANHEKNILGEQFASLKGKFIILDGGEGAGKSTQIKKIQEHFGDQVVVTREPGGSSYAEEIRNVILHSEHAGQADAKTHFALFWAARADHLKNTIMPALESGKHVVCDRFDSSTFAYQIFGQEAGELKDFFFQMRDFYLGDIKPDLYVFFDVDPEVGLSRKKGELGADMTHFDKRELAFHTRMRQGLLEFFNHVPHVVVDANPDFDTVHTNIITILNKTFND